MFKRLNLSLIALLVAATAFFIYVAANRYQAGDAPRALVLDAQPDPTGLPVQPAESPAREDPTLTRLQSLQQGVQARTAADSLDSLRERIAKADRVLGAPAENFSVDPSPRQQAQQARLAALQERMRQLD